MQSNDTAWQVRVVARLRPHRRPATPFLALLHATTAARATTATQMALEVKTKREHCQTDGGGSGR